MLKQEIELTTWDFGDLRRIRPVQKNRGGILFQLWRRSLSGSFRKAEILPWNFVGEKNVRLFRYQSQNFIGGSKLRKRIKFSTSAGNVDSQCLNCSLKSLKFLRMFFDKTNRYFSIRKRNIIFRICLTKKLYMNLLILDILNITKKFHNLSKLWKMLTVYKLVQFFSFFYLRYIELCSRAHRSIKREIYFLPFNLNISSDLQNESSKITHCIKKNLSTRHRNWHKKLKNIFCHERSILPRKERARF